jgi:hypothetical protein
MGLDRRILSILYYNDIIDVNDVEKFIGEKDGYYIVVIKGEIKKLKVPGFVYTEEAVEEKINDVELENEFEESENIFQTVVDSVKSNSVLSVETYTMEKIVMEEPAMKEPVVKVEKVKSDVKTKNKSIKKTDDDIDDFIKSI